MLCTSCKTNPATVYFSRTVNGKKTEEALCSACFEKKKSLYAEPDFGDLLTSVFFGKEKPILHSTTVKACTVCGSTWREICQSGKVGCPECYRVFRTELSDTVQSIHGKRTHCGRVPKTETTVSDSVKAETKEDKIAGLQRQLDQAVAEQNYEHAAELRDEIRRLTQEA